MSNRALQQSPLYADALSAMGVPVCADPQTGAQWITRGPLSVATRIGPDIRLNSIRRMCGRRMCIVTPDTVDIAPLRAAGFRQIMTAATIAEIDLTAPIFPHVKWRNAIRKAAVGPLTTQHRLFDPPTDHWLLQADLIQQKSRNYRGLPHGIVHNWPRKHRLISLANLNGEPVAAMLFLQHGNTVTYQIGWTGPNGRQHSAHQLLLHEAGQNLISDGITKIDLGTVDSVNAPGLARFKARSGATLRQLGGTWIAWPRWQS